ncbi:MAG: hypothetical protein IT206_08130 [Fimbriimonadaceae bacterium]|nr:hypothetical protein [Fimbriimonadaceae bacterium]
MKQQLPTPVVIGIIAAVLLLGGFFVWRSAGGSASYTAEEKRLDQELTKPTGKNYYGSPDGFGQAPVDPNSEAGRRAANR